MAPGLSGRRPPDGAEEADPVVALCGAHVLRLRCAQATLHHDAAAGNGREGDPVAAACHPDRLARRLHETTIARSTDVSTTYF